MRQRKIKNLDEKFEMVCRYLIEEPKSFYGEWKQVFGNSGGIYLELGCGKGNFVIGYAEAYEDRNYIGIEGQASVALRALQKLEETTCGNVRIACEFVNDPSEIFADGEVSGIYLNFSDPWPKLRHAKRRLTHRDYLKQYRKILTSEGFVEIKTDNEALFEFTLEEIADIFEVASLSRNLHETDLAAAKITTEYEDKFRADGKNIYYVKLMKS